MKNTIGLSNFSLRCQRPKTQISKEFAFCGISRFSRCIYHFQRWNIVTQHKEISYATHGKDWVNARINATNFHNFRHELATNFIAQVHLQLLWTKFKELIGFINNDLGNCKTAYFLLIRD